LRYLSIRHIKENVQRAKEKWHPYMKKKKLEGFHEYHEKGFEEDVNPIIVNCNKLSKEGVVRFIMKKLGAK